MDKIERLEAIYDGNGIDSRYQIYYEDGHKKTYRYADCYMKDLPKEYEVLRHLEENNTSLWANQDCQGLTYCDTPNAYAFGQCEKIEPFITARDNPTDEIIEEREFINGFKVVRFKNGEFGYIRESDNKLMPYRFDVATDFNSYGLALVGKNCKVNYIDENFQVFEYDIKYPQKTGHYLLDYWITMQKDMLWTDYEKELFSLRKVKIGDKRPSFDEMTCFFEGEKPFAIMGEFYKECSTPITPTGEVARFHNYYHPEKEESLIMINGGRLDAINDCAIMYPGGNYNNPKVYSPTGTSFTYEDLIKFTMELDLIKILQAKAKEDIGYDKSEKLRIEKYYQELNIDFVILDSGEIITKRELARRIVSLKEFKKYLEALPYGYDRVEEVYTKVYIKAKKSKKAS